MNEVLEIIGWILGSAVKFLFTVPALLLTSHRPWYIDMLIVAFGGSLGVYIFTYLGIHISKWLEKFHLFRFKFGKLRKFIRIKNSFGLIGLAILSPILFSIPVGCIISTSFEHDKGKIIRMQLFSVIFWSIFFFSLKGIFHINLGNKIK